MHQEQGSILLLCLRDMSLPTTAWRKTTVHGPMARLATVVVGVIPGRLALANGVAISADLASRSLLLLAAAWMPATFLGAKQTRSFLILLLVKGAPLLHRV